MPKSRRKRKNIWDHWSIYWCDKLINYLLESDISKNEVFQDKKPEKQIENLQIKEGENKKPKENPQKENSLIPAKEDNVNQKENDKQNQKEEIVIIKEQNKSLENLNETKNQEVSGSNNTGI